MSTITFTAVLLALALASTLPGASAAPTCPVDFATFEVCHESSTGSQTHAFASATAGLVVGGGRAQASADADPAAGSARVVLCEGGGVSFVVTLTYGCRDTAEPPAVPTDPQVWIDWARRTVNDVVGPSLPCGGIRICLPM